MTALHVHTGHVRATPAHIMLSAIPSLPRPVLARLVERMIDRLDDIDGDPDIEANGDEMDGDNAEDAFGLFSPGIGGWEYPGCPISDPDIGEDDRDYG